MHIYHATCNRPELFSGVEIGIAVDTRLVLLGENGYDESAPYWDFTITLSTACTMLSTTARVHVRASVSTPIAILHRYLHHLTTHVTIPASHTATLLYICYGKTNL